MEQIENHYRKEKEYTIFVDDEGIVNIIVPQLIDEEETYKALKKFKEALKSLKEKRKVLVDMMNTRDFITSDEVRKNAADFLKAIQDNPESMIVKGAVFGGPIVVRTIGKFILTLAGVGELVKFFDSKAQALKWLEEP